MSQLSLRRVASHEIPDSSRWQINAAWDVEYNWIRQYIADRANHNVGARINQTPAERAAGAKIDGKVVPADVNAIYGAMPSAIDADTLGKANRGELERLAPSPVTIGLLAAGTIVTVLLEISIFLVMWLLGQGGNLITVGVGALLAGFGYLAGEGLGRLLIAREDKEQTAGALAWIFFASGLTGIIGMTVIRYLAARAAAEEGEEVAGLIAIVILTALVAAAVAVFHAAHMERSERYRKLVAKMYSAQIVFSTQQARENHGASLWTYLYDQAVEALVSGRSASEVNTNIPPPSNLFSTAPPAPASPPAPTPSTLGVIPEPKSEQ